MSRADELLKLISLRDSGEISQDEFQRLKDDLLAAVEDRVAKPKGKDEDAKVPIENKDASVAMNDSFTPKKLDDKETFPNLRVVGFVGALVFLVVLGAWISFESADDPAEVVRSDQFVAGDRPCQGRTNGDVISHGFANPMGGNKGTITWSDRFIVQGVDVSDQFSGDKVFVTIDNYNGRSELFFVVHDEAIGPFHQRSELISYKPYDAESDIMVRDENGEVRSFVVSMLMAACALTPKAKSVEDIDIEALLPWQPEPNALNRNSRN